MHAVEFTPTARRNLLTLPEKITTACVEFIFGPLAENPHRAGKPLVGPLAGRHSARRGGYRFGYRIDDDRLVVVITRIDHRADLYRTG